MAARKMTLTHQEDVRRTMWRFYVYEMIADDGSVVYVGKGSGRRLDVQRRKLKLRGREVARFKRENDAYAFEVARIAECKPALNKCAGGNGSVVVKRRDRKSKWQLVFECLGSRRYAARLMLAYDLRPFNIPQSKIDLLRQVANGPRR